MDPTQSAEHAVNLLLPSMNLREVGEVAVVTFDVKEEKVNTLNSRLFPQFDQVMEYLQKSDTIKAVVLCSGKPGSFIAGADIKELQSAGSEEEVFRLSQGGQEFFDRLASLSQPVVAAIDGVCLGGGLELALACDYRLASSSPKTKLGFPEVMLGLLPGAGGTQRLPELIGLEKSLQMMLTGMQISSEKAKKFGLVDHIVYSEGLEEKALEAARALAAGKLKPVRKKQKGATALLSKVKAGKKFILSKALEGVQKKTRGLYPAPLGIIEVLQETIDKPSNGYKKESEVFARLSQTSQCKGLMSLYFGQNELKKNPCGTPKEKLTKVGILGAGLMGAGIALVSAQKGFHVRMRDLQQKQLGAGKKYIWDQLKGRVKRKSMSSFAAQKIMSGVYTQTDLEHFDQVEILIEAVFEDINLKHKVLKEVESVASENLIFASNTSALPISEIAKASKRPERVIGMHYFSPVHKMPLLEIIVTKETSDDVLSHAVDVGLRQGKTVIVVNDGTGFYTTRILAPFMDEAALLALEGVDPLTLDRAIKDFGYPVGPIALIDEVGIDVAIHVSQTMGEAFGSRLGSGDTSLLEDLLSSDAKGRKSGRGFYLYDSKKPSWSDKLFGKKKAGHKPVNPQVLDFIRKKSKGAAGAVDWEDIQKRMCYRMLNEAAYCLQDEILRRPVDGDIGAVFGLGFPPFHGGPFRYMDATGLQKIVDGLNRYRDLHGARFEPCPMLTDMAREGKVFYPDA